MPIKASARNSERIHLVKSVQASPQCVAYSSKVVWTGGVAGTRLATQIDRSAPKMSRHVFFTCLGMDPGFFHDLCHTGLDR